MEFDFVSEVEKKFFSDNLLLNEDWDNIDVDPVENVNDFVSLLDIEPAISPEDFMRSLPDELELPILESGDVLMPDETNKVIDFHPDLLRDLSDSSDSGLDCGSTSSTVLVKDEPLSPASSLGSETQQDVLSNTQISMETGMPLQTSFNGLPFDVKLESPPLTPERDAQSELCGLALSLNNTKPTNGVKIDFSNSQVLSATSLPLGSSVITGPNGVNVIQAQPPSLTPNVAQVLNKKVKIQPKPLAPVQAQAQAQLPTPTPGKPLVLTPEQFAKLTSQGVLKFHNPLDQTPAPATSPTTQRPPVITERIATVPMTTDMGNVQEKLVKRQQRMIKNRESACLSRKRKKEYVSTMEKRLQDSVDENTRLREQNERLKQCIKSLQSENEKLKSIFNMGGSAKKATCVMAVLLLVSLNLGPLTNIFHGSQTKQQLLNPVPENFVHHGRSLMAFNETEDLPSVDRHAYLQPLPNLKSISAALEGLKQRYASSAGPTSSDLMVVKALEEINVPVSMCPSYFNSSESQRLMKELTGWVLGHKAGMKAAADIRDARQGDSGEQQARHPKQRSHHRKKYAAPRKLKAALKGGFEGKDQSNNGPSAAYEVQLFTGSDRRYEDFFQAVQIRNDTFYVVSFRRDHLLLPATAHNKTMRPRMSLLMPAQPINENDTAAPPAGNIAMMQIDCEVTATKLLHISKSTIPQNVDEWSKNNHTAPPSVERERQRKKWQQNQKWRRKP